MNRLTEQLKKAVFTAQAELDRSQRELDRAYKACDHKWVTVYTPEYKKGYTIPGDPPGTMGVDWRGPTYVSSKTIKKWTRTCSECGKSEVTDRVNEITRIEETPKW